MDKGILKVSTKEKKVSNKALDKFVEKILSNILKSLGKELVHIGRASINKGKRTGITYMIKGKEHVASASGEYPKTIAGTVWQAGNLSSGLSYSVDRKLSTMTFSSSADYSRFLEYKPTSEGGRPYMRRIKDIAKEKAISMVKDTSKGF